MHEFTVTEAQKRLPELVDEALGGEEVLIKNHSGAAVKLTAVANSGQPRFGSAHGLIDIGPDFDAPLPDFERYS